MASALCPDVVIVDVGMPGLNGLDVTRRLVESNPAQKVLILTIADAEQLAEQALRAGARGFMLKSDPVRDLITAIDAVSRGRTFFTKRIDQLLYKGFLPPTRSSAEPVRVVQPLSPRERETLKYLVEGKGTREIAALLGVSTRTADTHRTHLYLKLKVHSASELIMFALRNNLCSVAPDGHRLSAA